MRLHFYGLVLILALNAGCGAVPATAGPDLLSTIVAGTLTAQPASTAIPTGTLAPASTLAAEPFPPHFVLTSAQNVNLRTQPGMLFPVSRVMPQGTSLQVLGRAPGGEWYSVITGETIVGWVQVNFVKGGFDGPPPPIIQPQGVQLVSGRVLDEDGNPISGIGFAVTQGTAANAPRTDATTDETGTFYAFLPQTASGAWHVGYTSIACASNVMDADCNCKGGACGQPQPGSLRVTLPLDGILTFVWR